MHIRATYCDLPVTEKHAIDTEIVSIPRYFVCTAVNHIAGLTDEHLGYSHPSISVVMCKFFKTDYATQLFLLVLGTARYSTGP